MRPHSEEPCRDWLLRACRGALFGNYIPTYNYQKLNKITLMLVLETITK